MGTKMRVNGPEMGTKNSKKPRAQSEGKNRRRLRETNIPHPPKKRIKPLRRGKKRLPLC